ncbi:MAG: J domain-containing protein [Rhizobiaceae bacterium]
MNDFSKYFDRIRIRPDPETARDEREPECQWDGCTNPGTHRAPVGRHKEGEYFRFCVDHVREYNKGYNYFSGLNNSDIARFQKEALTGHRPTWKIGAAGGARVAPDVAVKRSGRAGYYQRIRDPYNLFTQENAETQAARRPKPLEAKALETLGLGLKATGAEIKTRYKELVKRHHPDANGGNRESEERFREVLHAYRLLKQAGLC